MQTIDLYMEMTCADCPCPTFVAAAIRGMSRLSTPAALDLDSKTSPRLDRSDPSYARVRGVTAPESRNFAARGALVEQRLPLRHHRCAHPRAKLL
jgi:hypothetical protein